MRLLVVLGALLLTGACATAPPGPEGAAPGAAAPPARAAAPRAAPPPEIFESSDFVVVRLRAPETAEGLAARYLGDPGKAWMVEDYTGARTFTADQDVVIPKRPWNPAGVYASGYQLVPILVYHNIGPQAKGRLVIATSTFEEQMRYLKTEGYHVVSLAEFLEFGNLRRQLPKKSVVLAFDDGYRSFQQYAAPILKNLGFTATLFIYTDYVGGGRNALTWQDLRDLVAAGFDVQAHSKTHGDLRRAPGEPEAQYARRMQSELTQPAALLQRQLGRPVTALAYPYGWWDDELVRYVREGGYSAAFTVRRQANPSFAMPLRFHRSQIYAEMSLQEFVRNLNVFHAEDLR